MSDLTREASPDPREATVGDLIRQATEQLSRLIREELALARAEMAEKGKRAGIGAGMLGAGGLVALYGVGALLAAVVLVLAEAMPAWLAALIVAVVLFAVAAVLTVLGRKTVQQSTPPVPEETVRSVKADIEEVKERVRR
ncbi:MAG TPA: phage holin family protein [Pilimelia sp.]|nr:phage holin family protein [Pilimelia sp.]